ncbi:fluoride efflux transporter FluC [Arsukibacterium sp. UBA3155]|uniref:fluoride efflux transporter FluC n=1 Tax=Arsukibacterium sp. UBA3155 TaxID=1946058 RepID=UPI0025B92F01|nr:CrcB family protein [Arsukibacterium sp. UBA3155]
MSIQTHPALLLLLLAAAAAAAGMLRFAVTSIIARYWGVQFPLATLLVNSSGALAIGVVAAMPDLSTLGLIMMVGFLGSYTTVSSFSLQTISLWQSRHYQQAMLNVGLSFGLCLSLVWCGYAAGGLLW